MTTTLKVNKTIKLFIGGQFPRTESGRSFPLHYHGSDKHYAHICQASRKDLRAAVEAALKVSESWFQSTAYLKSQILYRMAEMTEGKRAEFTKLFEETLGWDLKKSNQAVDEAIDSIIYYAGFADKFQQVLSTLNPVVGNLHNFTFPEPVGVVGLIEDDHFDFGRLMAHISSIICSGNTCVVLLGKECPALISILGEVCATSDLPGGVVNLLSGYREELLEPMAQHMEIRSLSFQVDDAEALSKIRLWATENMKRVVPKCEETLSLKVLGQYIEYKTTWHPVGF